MKKINENIGKIVKEGYKLLKEESNKMLPYLQNRADGVNGHYCIVRDTKEGYSEFWHNDLKKWCSAGTVFELGERKRGLCMSYWKNHIERLQSYLNEVDESQIDRLLKLLWYAFNNDVRIFIIGNGGSAANASHFAQDLCKATYPKYDGLKIDTKNKTLKAISLCDNVPFITAVANDDGYEYIFVNQLKVYDPSDKDILIAISGSGNSPNILRAVDFANKLNMTVVGITGYDGGQLFNKTEFIVHPKVWDMYVVESIHSIIFHYIIEKLLLLRSAHDGTA